MRHGSLFSGIGGFDLASEWMGWENIFHCEINEFCQTILKYYWINAISYEDITKTDFSIWRGRIDILTGGFPCQPFSNAGLKKGTEDERHLWPEMLRAIREIEPPWVVGENVRGIVNWSDGLVFEQVQSDLEALSYEVQPFILPAASIGAPHKRDRVWFIAYSDKYANCQRPGSLQGDSKIKGLEEQHEIHESSKSSYLWNASNPDIRNKQWNRIFQRLKAGEIGGSSCSFERKWPNTYTISQRLRGKGNRIRKTRQFNKAGKEYDWQNFPTQPPVCNGDDGLPTELDGITFSKWRNESIRGGGNAIVPKLALQIFKAIQAISNQNEQP